MDGPVEGRGPAVADRARMDDETGVDRPHVVRNRGFEIRGHDEVRALLAHGLPDGAVLVHELHGQGVPAVPELGLNTLGEAVEGAREKQNMHGDLFRWLRSFRVERERGPLLTETDSAGTRGEFTRKCTHGSVKRAALARNRW